MSNVVYISFSKNTQLDTDKITVGKVADVWCSDGSTAAKVKSIVLADVPDVKSRRYVFSAIDVIRLIDKACPNTDINNIGVPDFVVSYKRSLHTDKTVEIIKVILVSMIVFFGGAFAIMAYGNDIDINSVMAAVCRFASGGEKMLPVLQVSSCVGLAVGIIIFYNHLGKRRREKDPTPLEVQMRLYEDDVNSAVINESEREGKTDVG